MLALCSVFARLESSNIRNNRWKRRKAQRSCALCPPFKMSKDTGEGAQAAKEIDWDAIYRASPVSAPWDSGLPCTQVQQLWQWLASLTDRDLDGSIGSLANVVEIGCGTGATIHWIHEQIRRRQNVLRAVGVDISPTAVRVAQERWMGDSSSDTLRSSESLRFVTANVLDESPGSFVDVHRGSFDVLIDVQVSHVLGPAAVRAAARLLRSGGVAFAVCGSQEAFEAHPWTEGVSGPCLWRKEDFEAMWMAAGFSIERVFPSMFDSTPAYQSVEAFPSGPPGCWAFAARKL